MVILEIDPPYLVTLRREARLWNLGSRNEFVCDV